MLLAKKDEVVTCKNGHPICKVAADIAAMDTVRPEQFESWAFDYVPRSFEPIPTCPLCGAKFIRGDAANGHELHINDLWRKRWWRNSVDS